MFCRYGNDTISTWLGAVVYISLGKIMPICLTEQFCTTSGTLSKWHADLPSSVSGPWTAPWALTHANQPMGFRAGRPGIPVFRGPSLWTLKINLIIHLWLLLLLYPYFTTKFRLINTSTNRMWANLFLIVMFFFVFRIVFCPDLNSNKATVIVYLIAKLTPAIKRIPFSFLSCFKFEHNPTHRLYVNEHANLFQACCVEHLHILFFVFKINRSIISNMGL